MRRAARRARHGPGESHAWLSCSFSCSSACPRRNADEAVLVRPRRWPMKGLHERVGKEGSPRLPRGPSRAPQGGPSCALTAWAARGSNLHREAEAARTAGLTARWPARSSSSRSEVPVPSLGPYGFSAAGGQRGRPRPASSACSAGRLRLPTCARPRCRCLAPVGARGRKGDYGPGAGALRGAGSGSGSQGASTPGDARCGARLVAGNRLGTRARSAPPPRARRRAPGRGARRRE
jgi:hypothetical protein